MIKSNKVVIYITILLLSMTVRQASLQAQNKITASDSSRTALYPFGIRQLDAALDFIEAHHLAMGSVAVAQNGKLLYQRTLALPAAVQEKELPAAQLQGIKHGQKSRIPSFVYTTGSITKMFTAVMILQLVQEGALRLDTKLSAYYPGIPQADSVTIEMLLRHRSGLPDYTVDKIESLDLDSLFSSVDYDYASLQTNLGWLVQPIAGPEERTEATLHLIEQGKAHFKPDTDFEYNNSGYWLLAGIIEKCTDRSYSDNIKTRITRKLGLRHTLTAEALLEKSGRGGSLKIRGSYYYCDGWQLAQDLYLPNVRGAGDILSTPEDLLQFMQGLYQGKLVAQKTLDKMADFYDADSSQPSQFGMGLERAIWQDNTLAVGHSGDTYFNHGVVLYFPKTGLSICCLLNGLSPLFDRNKMLDMLYKAAKNEQIKDPEIDQWQVQPWQVNALAGAYYCDTLKMTINVLKDCRTLLLYPKGQEGFATYWIRPYQISQPIYDMNIQFEQDGRRFKLIQHGKTYNFVKKNTSKKE